MKSKDQICLEYLADKMYASASMVGKAIVHLHEGNCGSNYKSVGAAILGRLRYLGFVVRLPDLNAWRLSAEGRDYLKTLPKGQ